MFSVFRLDNAEEMLRWDAFVDSHAEGSPFHLSAWLKTISQAYDIVPYLYVSQSETNSIRAVAPFFLMKGFLGSRRLFSLPFSDFCYPLGVEKGNIQKLLQWILEEQLDKLKYIEIRGPLEDVAGFVAHPYYKRHFLRLDPDPQKVLGRVDKRTIQYNIRKARREGVQIIEDNTPKGTEEFYKLHLLTRKKHGIPHQPKRFFLSLWQNMIEKDQAFILLAAHESHIVAAGLFMKHKRKIYYKYNVSNPAYLVKFVPNHLLTWTAIEKACLAGYDILDFGRTAPDNAGLMRYKHMWGAEDLDLPYYYFPGSAFFSSRNENGFIYRLATSIWRYLPEPIASKIGPKIMKIVG